MKKKILYGVALVLAITISFTAFHKVFSFKYGEGIYNFKVYRELPKDSLDLLLIGSSHAFEDINPAILWEDDGIAAFDLCGEFQPMWNSYYNLKEALKYQTPKLVLLEGYTLTLDLEYSEPERIIKNTYGLKPSVNRIKSNQISTPKGEHLSYLLEYIQYHNRYNAIEAEDFKKYKDNEKKYKDWKGFGNNFEVMEFPDYEPVINDGTRGDIPDKQEEYYIKIIEMCRDKNIPLLITVSPYAGYTMKEMAIHNTAADIAASYKVPFVNYNEYTEEMGFDGMTDAADIGHLSAAGSAKLTHFMAPYFLENYEWEDHTGDPKYESWNKDAHYYNNQMIDHRLGEITDTNEYAEELTKLNDDFIFAVYAYSEDWSSDLIVQYMDLLAEKGINLYGDEKAMVYEDGEVTLASPHKEGYFYSKRFDGKELLIDEEGIFFNRINHGKVKNGINITIYDKITGEVADAVGITPYGIER